ncbi:UNVERIFIED_CONTAM: hypothetical protein C3P02_20360, partial [Clostridioides difficile]
VLRDQRREERAGVARREEQRDRQAGRPRPGARLRQAREGGAGGVPRQGSAGRGLRRRTRAAAGA